MSQDFTPIKPSLKASRIIGLAAAIIIVISQVVLLYAKPYSGPSMPRETYFEVVIMVIMAILAVWGSTKLNPVPLFIASLVSFSTPGEYSLRVFFVHEATQLGSLLYIAAALTILIQKKKLEAAYIIGLAAAILAVIFQAVLLYAELYKGISMPKETYLEVAIIIVMAILAAWGSLKLKPIPLFIAFLVSLAYPVHYIVGVRFVSIVYWGIRLCDLLYLVAGLIIFIQEKKIEAARIIGLAAAAMSIVLYGVMLSANLYDGGLFWMKESYAKIAIMIVIAILAAWGSLKFKPVLLFIAFFGSFFPIGFFMFGLPSIFKLIGICNLLFLVAAIVMYVQKRKEKKSDQEIYD